MSFIHSLKNALTNTTAVTENGAVGFCTTGRALLDLNFAVASLRNATESEIADRYAKAYYEDIRLAAKWLMFASDVRQGLGERRLLRVCLVYLAENHPGTVRALLPLIPEYSRWDNLLCLLDTAVSAEAVALIRAQLEADQAALAKGQPISLCAKWLPSENASSTHTRRLAGQLASALGMTRREYRQMLSGLRKRLHLVETDMSSGHWDVINYEAVPSRANLIYRNAFLRNDEERRHAYLDGLSKGTTTIHGQTLYPHDIVHAYFSQEDGLWARKLRPKDEALEALWADLPDYTQGSETTLCVADGSGSMLMPVGNSGVTCLDVANALAIYFAERCKGPFHDHYITFSEHPQLVGMAGGRSLRNKIEIARHYNEVANTNIEAVFELILTTARRDHLSQKELPATVLILSDMEFDMAACCHQNGRPDQTLFETLAARYTRYGYRLPRLVFWNIGSRTNVIPVRENGLGVALVSGFSPAIVRMVLSSRTDPYECLLEQLNTPRYAPVEEALAAVIS